MINTTVQSTSKSATISREHDILFISFNKKCIQIRAPKWKKLLFVNGFILISQMVPTAETESMTDMWKLGLKEN